VAGAILIVSKELVMCVHGYLYITVVQPYKIGDVIELNLLHGRVVDIDMFATTLTEQAVFLDTWRALSPIAQALAQGS